VNWTLPWSTGRSLISLARPLGKLDLGDQDGFDPKVAPDLNFTTKAEATGLLRSSDVLLGRIRYETDPSGVLHQMQDPLEIVMFGSTLVNLGIIRWFEPLLLLVFWFIKELVSGHLLHIVILKCHSVTRPANALPDLIGGVTLTSLCQNKCHSANRLPD